MELDVAGWWRSVLTLVAFCATPCPPALVAEPFNIDVPPVRGDEDAEGVGIGSDGGLSEDIMFV